MQIFLGELTMQKKSVATAILTSALLISSTPAFALSDTEAALLGAVGGQLIGGKTTLGDHGGEIESWMIVASLLGAAADKIVHKPKSDTPTIFSQDTLLAIDDEAIDVSLPAGLTGEISQINRDFSAACSLPMPSVPVTSAGLGSTLAAVISGAPTPETHIDEFRVTPVSETLVDALLSKAGGKLHRLSDLRSAKDSPLTKAWGELRNKRITISLSPCGKTEKGKALIARYDTFAEKLVALGDKGEPSLLQTALRLEQYADAPVLRVHIERAGGTVINTDTIFTRLGLPAIRIAGALIVGFRQTGSSISDQNVAGVLVCRAPKISIGALHRGGLPHVSPESCTDVTKIVGDYSPS
jgi:hypothetical protein